MTRNFEHEECRNMRGRLPMPSSLALFVNSDLDQAFATAREYYIQHHARGIISTAGNAVNKMFRYLNVITIEESSPCRQPEPSRLCTQAGQASEMSSRTGRHSVGHVAALGTACKSGKCSVWLTRQEESDQLTHQQAVPFWRHLYYWW